MVCDLAEPGEGNVANDFSVSKKDALYTRNYCSLQSRVYTKGWTITDIIFLINLMTDL